ncbi:MAG: PEPxxWA-CTERM sorting domain-containing protein [Pseudomonadota bacterium]
MRLISSAACAATLAMVLSCGAAQAATISGLYNTGVDDAGVALAGGNGVVDTHYLIASNAPGYFNKPAVTYYNGAYLADDADSRWVSLDADGVPDSAPNGSTTSYGFLFDLTGFDLSTVVISGGFAADNAAGISLNGFEINLVANGYTALTPFLLTTGFREGINTLEFTVLDFGAPTALRVDNLVGRGELLSSGAIPEPGTWALMIAGFGLAGCALRRRSRTVGA